jgi:hypothetical protein
MTTSSNPASATAAARRNLARRARRTALALAAAALAGPAAALLPVDPDQELPLDVTVSGSLIFRGCTPSPANVTVRTSKPARTATPGSAVRLADGSIRMNYRIVVGKDNDPTLPQQFTVTPRVDPAVCGSAGFTPSSRVAGQYAQAVNFELQAINPTPHYLPVDGFLLLANVFLSQVGLHLNNDGEQTSSVTIGGTTASFEIPVEKRDLPFPLPGSGLFTIRNMDLQSATMSRAGTAFETRLQFETNGVEVKGYHSTLGDLSMPDFQMSPIVLAATTGLGVRNGRLTMGFTNTRLEARIASTGACNVYTLDWCNYLFGTSGSLRRSFELQAFQQLNGSLIQGALGTHLANALAAQGILGPIGKVELQGDLIVVTTIQ